MNDTTKQAYERPTLIVHGDVRTLTQGMGTANGDGGQFMMTPNN
ncbi:MAG: lasso RiPP family leader peptide-containing protein [Rhizobiales bacterium]|nr:lasso RiPP family leader peptide-containing protein [Hyphomicrobiales bacterium]